MISWVKNELKAQAGNAHPIVKISAGLAGGILAMGICKMIGVSSEVARPVAAGVAAFFCGLGQGCQEEPSMTRKSG